MSCHRIYYMFTTAKQAIAVGQEEADTLIRNLLHIHIHVYNSIQMIMYATHKIIK